MHRLLERDIGLRGVALLVPLAAHHAEDACLVHGIDHVVRARCALGFGGCDGSVDRDSCALARALSCRAHAHGPACGRAGAVRLLDEVFHGGLRARIGSPEGRPAGRCDLFGHAAPQSGPGESGGDEHQDPEADGEADECVRAAQPCALGLFLRGELSRPAPEEEDQEAGDRQHDGPAGAELHQPIAEVSGQQVAVNADEHVGDELIVGQRSGDDSLVRVHVDVLSGAVGKLGDEDRRAVTEAVEQRDDRTVGELRHDRLLLGGEGESFRSVRNGDRDDARVHRGVDLRAEQVRHAGHGEDEEHGYHQECAVEVPAPEGAEPIDLPRGGGHCLVRGASRLDVDRGHRRDLSMGGIRYLHNVVLN